MPARRHGSSSTALRCAPHCPDRSTGRRRAAPRPARPFREPPCRANSTTLRGPWDRATRDSPPASRSSHPASGRTGRAPSATRPGCCAPRVLPRPSARSARDRRSSPGARARSRRSRSSRARRCSAPTRVAARRRAPGTRGSGRGASRAAHSRSVRAPPCSGRCWECPASRTRDGARRRVRRSTCRASAALPPRGSRRPARDRRAPACRCARAGSEALPDFQSAPAAAARTRESGSANAASSALMTSGYSKPPRYSAALMRSPALRSFCRTCTCSSAHLRNVRSASLCARAESATNARTSKPMVRTAWSIASLRQSGNPQDNAL